MATAPRTLTSTWQQYEKYVTSFFKENKPREKVIVSLNNTASKSNAVKIGQAIGRLFFCDFEMFQDTKVEFLVFDGDSEDYPIWPTQYLEDQDLFLINPVGIFQFLEDCEAAASLLSTPNVRRSFLRYRYFAFLTELKKLPSKIVLFLLILQQVALSKKVADVETKHGIEQAEGVDYLTLLWAFKELERFLLLNNGLDLRSEYKISWYESDWSIGV